MRHSSIEFDAQRRASVALLVMFLLAACGHQYTPTPPHTAFEGLPVSGSLADAHFAGLTRCYPIGDMYHCRKNDVWFQGQGPFVAAVDMTGSDGSGGFQQLVLWHDRDQDALFAVGDALKRQGWKECLTGEGRRGDQAIYTRPGEPITITIELSYAGKRRLKLLPPWNKAKSC
jgi:hypothetical protein